MSPLKRSKGNEDGTRSVKVSDETYQRLQLIVAHIARDGWRGLGLDRCQRPSVAAVIDAATELMGTRTLSATASAASPKAPQRNADNPRTQSATPPPDAIPTSRVPLGFIGTVWPAEHKADATGAPLEFSPIAPAQNSFQPALHRLGVSPGDAAAGATSITGPCALSAFAKGSYR
jgi:hypothetical protein